MPQESDILVTALTRMLPGCKRRTRHRCEIAKTSSRPKIQRQPVGERLGHHVTWESGNLDSAANGFIHQTTWCSGSNVDHDETPISPAGKDRAIASHLKRKWGDKGWLGMATWRHTFCQLKTRWLWQTLSFGIAVIVHIEISDKLLQQSFPIPSWWQHRIRYKVLHKRWKKKFGHQWQNSCKIPRECSYLICTLAAFPSCSPAPVDNVMVKIATIVLEVAMIFTTGAWSRLQRFWCQGGAYHSSD